MLMLLEQQRQVARVQVLPTVIVYQMGDLRFIHLVWIQSEWGAQDLRQAPDAILPGNFVEQPVVAVADVELSPTAGSLPRPRHLLLLLPQ
jgi:hypothetical protein